MLSVSRNVLHKLNLRSGLRGLYANAGNVSAVQPAKPRTKMTTSRLQARYKKGIKLTMVTAYDYPSAQICDESLIDMTLVGDSVAMVVMGLEDTVSVTMDAMVHHCQAVKRGSQYSFLVGDLPFGSYNTVDLALHNATRLLKEGGMDAVKLEGGSRILPQIKALTDAGISVVGHVGLTPQSHRSLGGFTVQGKKPEQARRILEDALDLMEAGVTAIVLEMVPAPLAREITASVAVPTIGIGAGPHTSGQVLVYHDMLGLFDKFQPKFSRQYANLRGSMVSALSSYRADVMEARFPLAQHSFQYPTTERKGGASGNESSSSVVQKSRRFAVIGGGAMGSLFASQLSSVAANKVTVISEWAEHVETVNRLGLQVLDSTKSQQKLKQRSNVSAISGSNINKEEKNCADVVFVLVKARDSLAAAETARQLVSPGGSVVTIQNGLGGDTVLKSVFEEDNDVHLSFGITSYGARMVGPGVVQAAGSGCTTLFYNGDSSSSCHKAVKHCADSLKEAGMEVCMLVDGEDAQKQVWRKLAINAVINPLAALFNVSNGELLSHEPYARVLRALGREVATVSKQKISWSASELQVEVENVLRLTSDNCNSMLADVRRGVDTEFEHINGEVLKLTTDHRAVPINAALSTIFEHLSGEHSVLSGDETAPMSVLRTVAEVRRFRSSLSPGESVGFVPTMGALHAGHLSLIRAAKENCSKVVVSIFVNPTQFSEHEAFDEYPSTLEADVSLLSALGLVDVVFAPSPSEMYPNFSAASGENGRDNGQSVYVVPDRIESISAEGQSRPKFFTGVSTVCTKLFNIVQPTTAFFGQKDATQVIAIEQVVRELNMPVIIDVVETSREADGVAMSSRNVFLSAEDRAAAPIIYQTLSEAKKEFEEKGERRVRVLRQSMARALQSHPRIKSVDYISVANGHSSAELSDDDELCAASTMLSVAVTIGDTRLIDNIVLRQ